MNLVILWLALLIQPAPLYIVSPDFPNEGSIPAKCTCDGVNMNPTLIVNGMPEGTKSLTLIALDPDSPPGSTEWLVWNIPPTETIFADSMPVPDAVTSIRRNKAYRGPCPTSGLTQRYAFKVYAIDTVLNLKDGTSMKELEKAIEGHTLAKGELLGVYSRAMKVGSKK